MRNVHVENKTELKNVFLYVRTNILFVRERESKYICIHFSLLLLSLYLFQLKKMMVVRFVFFYTYTTLAMHKKKESIHTYTHTHTPHMKKLSCLKNLFRLCVRICAFK